MGQHLDKVASSDASVTVITSTEQSHHHPKACNVEQSPILLAKLQGCPLEYHKRRSPSSQLVHTSSPCTKSSSNDVSSQHQYHPETLVHPSIPAGTTITAVTTIPRTVQTICRKLDSPTDSGIESGSDASKICSGSSSCSSPRSSLEEPTTPSLADALPTLKRALEKPAMYDPMMHHKKFRRIHENSELRTSNSHLHSILTSPNYHHQQRIVNNGVPLAMTHSILAGTLKNGPKIMSEEHRKNQEILNRYIDQSESVVMKANSIANSPPPATVGSTNIIDHSPVSKESAPLNLSKKKCVAQLSTNGPIVEL